MNRIETSALISEFSDQLIRLNSLDGFSSWFFYSGMLFGRCETWWGRGGKRPAPHEGLDICFYKTGDGDIKTLDETTSVPALFDGHVLAISDNDFLGKSIFVRHDVRDATNWYLHTVYAHATPVAGLERESIVRAGEIIASIADIRERNLSIPAHLHLSVLFLPEMYPLDLLQWNLLGKSDQARFDDPMKYMKMPFAVKNYPPNMIS